MNVFFVRSAQRLFVHEAQQTGSGATAIRVDARNNPDPNDITIVQNWITSMAPMHSSISFEGIPSDNGCTLHISVPQQTLNGRMNCNQSYYPQGSGQANEYPSSVLDALRRIQQVF